MQYVPGVFLNLVYGLVPRRWDYNRLSTLHAYFRFGISNRNVFVILMKCTGIMIYPSVLGNPRLSQISQIFKSCLISFDLVIKAINCL